MVRFCRHQDLSIFTMKIRMGQTVVPISTTYVNPFYIWLAFKVFFPISTGIPEYDIWCIIEKRKLERVTFPTPPSLSSKSYANSYELRGENDNVFRLYIQLQSDRCTFPFVVCGSPKSYKKLVRRKLRKFVYQYWIIDRQSTNSKFST